MRLLFNAVVLACVSGRCATASLPTEHDLKAAYIFNILRFVEQRTIAPPPAVLTLGVHAAGPIEQSLQVLEGSVIRGRKLHIRVINQEADMPGCSAIFLGRSTGKAAKLLAAAGTHGLLTIGNDDGFIPSGGMIALLVDSRRIVVEISSETIASSNWVVSSHLLEVARIVNRSVP